MRRKLLLLDIALVAVAIAAVFQFRGEWRKHKARELATLNRPVTPVAVPPLAAIPRQPDVVPASYLTIGERMLFDRSRNSVVTPPPPPPTPPPPPMPALPIYHGMMNIGSSGPIAILSLNAAAAHQAIHPGDAIGQFTLVDVNSSGITLEWNGEKIYKTADELTNRASAAAAPDQSQPADSRPATPPPAAAPPAPVRAGPGETTSFGNRVCNLNDGVAEGAVVDGFRKVIHLSPFGRSCTYDPVQ